MQRGDVSICCNLSRSCLFFGAIGQSRIVGRGGGDAGVAYVQTGRTSERCQILSDSAKKNNHTDPAAQKHPSLCPTRPLKWPPTPPLFALLSSSLTHWTCPRFCMYLHRHASSSPSTAPVTQPDWSYLHLRSLALYTSFLLRLCLKWIFSSLTENVWTLQNLIWCFTLLLVLFCKTNLDFLFFIQAPRFIIIAP